jgi:hypothetical protein
VPHVLPCEGIACSTHAAVSLLVQSRLADDLVDYPNCSTDVCWHVRLAAEPSCLYTTDGPLCKWRCVCPCLHAAWGAVVLVIPGMCACRGHLAVLCVCCLYARFGCWSMHDSSSMRLYAGVLGCVHQIRTQFIRAVRGRLEKTSYAQVGADGLCL